MVSVQTLKLLDALLAGSSGSEKEKLYALYKEAYCGTENFKELKLLLERSEFHGVVGRELLTKSEDVIQAGFANAGSFGDNLTVMEYVIDKIRENLKNTDAYIHSANVSGAAMHVIDKRQADNVTEYYEKLFHYVCCVYTSLYGESILENMKISTGIRSVDLVRNMNEELCNLIADARHQTKPQVWRIVRKYFGGVNLVNYNGFVVEYGSVDVQYLQNRCDQVTPTLFVPKNDDSVLCCAVGHLTNLNTADGGKIFGAQVVSQPPMNGLDHLELEYGDIQVSLLLSKLAGSGVCVMKPELLVEMLNRYFMIKAAKENEAKGCVFCGKQSCQHFRINRSFANAYKR